MDRREAHTPDCAGWNRVDPLGCDCGATRLEAHTPGPWETTRGRSDRRFYVTQTGECGHAVAVMLTSPHAESDATLIAAAPELLGELRATADELAGMLDFWRKAGFGSMYADTLEARERSIRARIAKATGGAS